MGHMFFLFGNEHHFDLSWMGYTPAFMVILMLRTWFSKPNSGVPHFQVPHPNMVDYTSRYIFLNVHTVFPSVYIYNIHTHTYHWIPLNPYLTHEIPLYPMIKNPFNYILIRIPSFYGEQIGEPCSPRAEVSVDDGTAASSWRKFVVWTAGFCLWKNSGGLIKSSFIRIIGVWTCLNHQTYDYIWSMMIDWFRTRDVCQLIHGGLW